MTGKTQGLKFENGGFLYGHGFSESEVFDIITTLNISIDLLMNNAVFFYL